jgi:hypothetical protein
MDRAKELKRKPSEIRLLRLNVNRLKQHLAENTHRNKMLGLIIKGLTIIGILEIDRERVGTILILEDGIHGALLSTVIISGHLDSITIRGDTEILTESTITQEDEQTQ